MELYSDDQVQNALHMLSGWQLAGKEIRKSYRFENFTRAMGFVTSLALAAERANHHPDIDIRWNTVNLALSTHSAGGLTAKDFTLAGEIDALVPR